MGGESGEGKRFFGVAVVACRIDAVWGYNILSLLTACLFHSLLEGFFRIYFTDCLYCFTAAVTELSQVVFDRGGVDSHGGSLLEY